MNKIFILLLMILIGCNSTVEPPTKENNKDIVELKKPEPDKFNEVIIRGKIAIYRNGSVYTVPELALTRIDNNGKVLEYQDLMNNIGYGRWLYIDGNETGSKLLLIRSRFSGKCAGSLYEYNTTNQKLTLLIDSTNYVSSARYLKGDNTKLIYYKYGKLNYNSEYVPIDYINAGYYSLDLVTKEEKQIFRYVSESGLDEMINAFDIHPSNKKLLIGITKGTYFEMRTPSIGVYDISSKKLDTLNIVFEKTNRRVNLWLRYNKTATKILYSYFPHNSYGHVTNGTSEAGIIDVSTLNRKIIDLDTRDKYSVGSVQLSVEWDSNDQRIIFCSGQVKIDGTLGSSSLYILKTIP